jgi:hypothetical protein
MRTGRFNAAPGWAADGGLQVGQDVLRRARGLASSSNVSRRRRSFASTSGVTGVSSASERVGVWASRFMGSGYDSDVGPARLSSSTRSPYDREHLPGLPERDDRFQH